MVKFPDHVEFKYDEDTPLAFAPSECAELICQIHGGAKDMPLVDNLFFNEAYVDAARTKVLVRGPFLSPSFQIVLPLLCSTHIYIFFETKRWQYELHHRVV